ncbi:MAG: DUF3795 domain-containing protein [bacterium]
MTKELNIANKLIAPCGMNCGICKAYLRDKNTCPGCRESDENKAVSCKRCIIKNCQVLSENNWKFCFKCGKYPCARMKSLDERYRRKYRMSMIENLKNIEEHGIRRFVRNEKLRWQCSECGGVICVHGGYCFSCNAKMQ